MQQYSSLPEPNSSVDATPSLLRKMQQFRAELSLERSLNQLQSRLNDCLVSAYSNVSQSRTTEAEIFQTVVNQLSMALNGITVAIALFPARAKMAEVAYISASCSPYSQLVLKTKDQQLQLKLQTAIAVLDLQQLEKQETNDVWRLTDDTGGIIGWLIVSQTSPKSDEPSVILFPSPLKSEFLLRAIQQCVAALAQLKKIQSLQQYSQKISSSNEKLERSNQLKNQFLANTSHEIRTPLSSIIGFSQLLLAQGYDPTRENHQEYLRIIQSSGKHLLTLINDILDLSKIEANQLEVEWENINVPEICRNVLALVKEKAANKGLQLRLELNPDVTNLVADPLRLKQMLLNLLFNSVKFTKTGSVGLEVVAKGEFVHFIVWDTGIGISKENQRRLFQPYFQIANPLVNCHEGTGLGLTVTRKLVEIHGGCLEVESEFDHGSRFTIILPVEPVGKPRRDQGDMEGIAAASSANQQDEEAQSILMTPSSSLDILLVENDLPNAELISIYLGRLGYQVTWAKNATEMWSALTRLQPMLILMDVYLPDGNGLKLVQQLREEPEYEMIPIIMQTAMAMKGDRETCLAAGVNDYISKPLDLSDLGNLVAKYIKLP
ncbi:hybrid histidine kinase/response regulator HrmK [Nodularia harveyana UHCC-0300]|uniref:histidine kinase n=1 Tax=Nodularia harveyana UHCC-0300 TaxID=2974287 RepID=A0ABU5UIG5_9CYAN|nr:hybrid histidine kinase/response regulator HrmK [Nodularia harveyana]MEA5583362.1 hybrid histidine kinase/response regulator HrmK [Nodularia harveyana UHCC-0300]